MTKNKNQLISHGFPKGIQLIILLQNRECDAIAKTEGKLLVTKQSRKHKNALKLDAANSKISENMISKRFVFKLLFPY